MLNLTLTSLKCYSLLRLLTITILTLLGTQVVRAEELLVYAGAGLRPAMEPLATLFETQNHAKVLLEYGGSGQLLTRFQASRKGDVFVPGSKVYFEKLITAGDLKGTTQDIVAHTPVVGVTQAKATTIKNFSDLATPGVRVGLGDPKAMALGQTAETILAASGIGEAIRANVVLRAATVKQLALYVSQGDIDAAIIGRSDAILNTATMVMLEIPKHWYKPDIIAVGILSTTTHPDLAKRFADLLASPKGVAIFKQVGFLSIDKTP